MDGERGCAFTWLNGPTSEQPVPGVKTTGSPMPQGLTGRHDVAVNENGPRRSDVQLSRLTSVQRLPGEGGTSPRSRQLRRRGHHRERSRDPDSAGRSLEPRRQRSVVGGVSSMQSSSEAAAPCHIAVPSKDGRDGIMRRSRRRRGRAGSPCTQSAQEAGNTTLLRRVHNPEMPARSDWFLGSSSTARTTQGAGAAVSIAAARREVDSGAHGQRAGGQDLSLARILHERP